MTPKLAVVVFATFALAACGGAAATTDPPVAGVWREPASYSFTVDSQCGERALIGRFRVTVVGGKVTAAEGLDEPAQRLLRQRSPEVIPTLRHLLDQVAQARQAGADVATVEHDPVDGHPTKITIDHELAAIDDEECYTVSDFRAPASPSTSAR